MMTHQRTYFSKLNNYPLRENDEFGIQKVIEYYFIEVTDETFHEPQQLHQIKMIHNLVHRTPSIGDNVSEVHV